MCQSTLCNLSRRVNRICLGLLKSRVYHKEAEKVFDFTWSGVVDVTFCPEKYPLYSDFLQQVDGSGPSGIHVSAGSHLLIESMNGGTRTCQYVSVIFYVSHKYKFTSRVKMSSVKTQFLGHFFENASQSSLLGDVLLLLLKCLFNMRLNSCNICQRSLKNFFKPELLFTRITVYLLSGTEPSLQLEKVSPQN